MPSARRFRIAAACAGLAAVALLSLPAEAGRSCQARKPTPAAIRSGMELARLTSDRLDASGARVVVLARAGQNLEQYGLRHSHLGLAYKTGAGPWRVLHKLNECGSAVASIYRHGLADFFLDDLWRYEAAWVVPAPAVQDKLLQLIAAPSRITQLHVPPYSLVSYVWSDRYQQSNQWAVETLAAAMAPATVASRPQAQASLQSHGYEPTVLKLGPLTRLGGRITAANIAFDDHPSAKRFSDRIETVTVDSVFAWMARAGLASAPFILQP